MASAWTRFLRQRSLAKFRLIVVIVLGLMLFWGMLQLLQKNTNNYANMEVGTLEMDGAVPDTVRMLRELAAMQEREGNLLRHYEQLKKQHDSLVIQLESARYEMAQFKTQLERQDLVAQGLEVAEEAVNKNSVAYVGHDAEYQLGLPVLLFTATRGASLNRTIQSILEHLPEHGDFPIYVSQDGESSDVSQVINSFQGKLHHLRFSYVPHSEVNPSFAIYYRIASHYQYGLSVIFDEMHYERAIILEDDMLISPDFFQYFQAASRILINDPSLYCVSAWNDNGQRLNVFDSRQLYRTDVFPGLGWMLTSELWRELRSKWPHVFWDDWLRSSQQRNGRQCIYPEINRVYTFGKVGASNGQFFDDFLEPIYLNDEPVMWQLENLHYLEELEYVATFKDWLINAQRIDDIDQFPTGNSKDIRDFVFWYSSVDELTNILKKAKLMSDYKDGMPRTSYKGAIIFRRGVKRIFVAPIEMAETLKA